MKLILLGFGLMVFSLWLPTQGYRLPWGHPVRGKLFPVGMALFYVGFCLVLGTSVVLLTWSFTP